MKLLIVLIIALFTACASSNCNYTTKKIYRHSGDKVVSHIIHMDDSFTECYENVENAFLNNRKDVIVKYKGGVGNRCYFWLSIFFRLSGENEQSAKYEKLNKNQYYQDAFREYSYNREDFNELILHCNKGDMLSCTAAAVYSRNKNDKYRFTSIAADNKLKCYGILFANAVEAISDSLGPSAELRLLTDCSEQAGVACSKYGWIFLRAEFANIRKSNFRSAVELLSFICKNGGEDRFCDLLWEYFVIAKIDKSKHLQIFRDNAKNRDPLNYYKTCHSPKKPVNDIQAPSN